MPPTSPSNAENTEAKEADKGEHGQRNGQGQEEKKGEEKVPGRPARQWKKRRGFLELFAGLAGLTMAVQNIATGKAEVLPPGELKNKDGKFDLLDDHCLSCTAKEVDERVLWLHGAPPCHTFTFARRTDKHGKVPILQDPDHPES